MTIQNHVIREFPVAGPYQGSQALKKYLLRGEAVVVKEADNFLGLLAPNDLLSKPHNLVIDCLSPKPAIQDSDECLPSLLFMCQNNYDFLPVMRDNDFQGIVSRKQLFLQILKGSENETLEVSAPEIFELKKEIALKNKFLAIIGHDIKNLFTQVLGSLEMLDHRMESIHESKAQAILRLARKSAEQVSTTFEGMLLWARLSTGQLPFQPQELELNEQITKIVDQFQVAGNLKNISIKNVLSTELKIFADPNMLQCILLNLVYNAIKFTPGGEIWVDARQNEKETEIIVVDSGTGMTRLQQENLFKPGHSTSGTQNEMGSGIGMILCREFMEKHKGKIEVESEQGKGTRVVITFPQLKENAADFQLSISDLT